MFSYFSRNAGSGTGQRRRVRYWRTFTLLGAMIALLLAAVSVGASRRSGPPTWPAASVVQTLAPQAQQGQPALQLVVDTDTGVDDAAALAWLLTQEHRPVEVLGITTVAGNASVDNATNNVLTVLDVVGRTDIPVIMGAAAPLVQTHSHIGSFLHGPDGLWFVGWQNPHDLSGLPTDVAAFYRDTALANPGATLLALGPLTNVAQAIDQYPAEMALYSQIIVLGGAKYGGNTSPVAEFNIWQDPEAAEIVLTSGLPVTLLMMDAFNQFSLDQDDIEELMTDGTAAGQFLAVPLQIYAGVQMEQGEAAVLADVTAAIYLLRTNLGVEESALTKIADGEGLARGQTVVGLTMSERITMIADDAELSALADQAFFDPNFDFEAAVGAILMREPDNTLVIRDINERLMRRLFMRELTD